MSEKLQQGLTAARIGDKATARQLLTEVIQETPDDVRAWLELAGVVESLAEKRDCFAKVLTIDPNHAAAKAGLELVEQKLQAEGTEQAVLAPPAAVVGDSLPETEAVFCYRHPNVETGLRCNRCNKPICAKCAQRSPVGFRCPDCVVEIEDRFYSQAKGELNPYDQPLDIPFFTYILIGLNIVIWLAMTLAGGSTNNEVLVRFGANYGPLIFEGEYWRLFTSMFLHIGAQHLAFNVVGLIAFGFEMERVYGRYRYIVIYLLAGLFGNLASFAIRGPHIYSAGASGAIFGVIGMNLAFFFYYRRRLGEYGRQRRNLVLVLIGISLILGLTVMPSDNIAHLGGALAGFVLGYVLVPRYQVEPASNSSRYIVDKGSLRRRWWVPVLGIVILVGGVWQVLSFWSSVGDWLTAMTFQSAGDLFSTGETIEYGQTVEGFLTEPDDVDAWTFDGEAGQVITVMMSSSFLDSYLELYSPDGNFLIDDDDGGQEYDARIDRYILPASGRYVIFAHAADGSNAAYQLTLQLVDTLDPNQLDGSGGIAQVDVLQ